jgi:CshA-type fibril repeat protein
MRINNLFSSKKFSSVAILSLVSGLLVSIPTVASAVSTVSNALSVTQVAAGGKVDLTTTMPMLSAKDNSTQEIIQSIDATKARLTSADDVIAPTGWQVTYSQDGVTFLATPTNWNSVVKVKATGPINSAGLTTDGKQILSRSVQIPANGITRTATGSNGDGYDVVFDSRGYIFNTYHHGSPSATDCRKKIDGTSCGSSWPLNLTTWGFVTNDRPTNFVDNINNHLWFNTADASGAGYMCIDINVINAPKPCGGTKATAFHVLVPPAFGNNAYYTVNLVEANGMLFSWHQGAGKLMCFDYLANEGLGAPCAKELPATPRVVQTPGNSAQNLVNWRGLVIGYQSDAAVCVDSKTLETCAGWNSSDYKFAAWQTAVYVEPDAKGNQLGVCFYPSGTCFDDRGTIFRGNSTLQGLLSRHWFYSNALVTSGSKVLYSGVYLDAQLWCFDIALNAGCAKWNDGGYSGYKYVPKIYTRQLDPNNPNCLWTNGDDGVIRNVDITTSEYGCPSPSPRSTFSGDFLVPRMGCDASASLAKYNRFVLSNVVPGTDYTSGTLTVLDKAGTPVTSGGKKWISVPLVISGNTASVDLSTLSVADAGTNPEFVIDFEGRATITTAVGTISVSSDAAQLCLSLTTNVICPAATQFVAPQNSTTTFSAAGTTISQAGVRTVHTVANAALTIKAPTGDQCGSLLSGTVTNGLSGPVLAGARATLLNGTTGNPVLSPSNQPIATVSDAEGKFSFGYILPGSYRVGFTDLEPVGGIGTGDAVSVRLCAGSSASCLATVGVDFTAQFVLNSPSFTTVARANQSIEVIYNLPADASSDILYSGKNAATALDVLANDKATTGSTWNLSTLKLCSGTPAVCATTAVTVDPLQGTYSVNGSGKVIFTPVQGFVGVAKPITYQITDGTGRTDSAVLTPNVLEAPTANNDTLTGDFRSPISIKVTSNDSATAGTTIDASSVRLCAVGTTSACALTSVNIAGQGTYTSNNEGVVLFTPVANWTGTATSITYLVRDALGSASVATVTATVQAVAPAINTNELPGDLVNTSYSFNLSGTAGSATLPASPWIVNGLPQGLTYNASNGVISGTSTATGTFNVSIQYFANDGRKAFKTLPLKIGTAPVITNFVLAGQTKTWVPAVQYNMPIPDFQNTVEVGTFPLPATGAWSITSGSLPPGLTLNRDTGVISGTPTVECVGNSGIVIVTVGVTDSIGLTDTHVLELDIMTPPTITTGILKSVSGTADSESNSFTNGYVCGYAYSSIPINGSWRATGLPAGITLNANTGVMSGTPTKPGTYSPVISLTDSYGAVGTKTLTWNVIAPPSVATTTITPVESGLAMAPFTLTATQGTDLVRTTGTAWTASGLPAGLTLNAATGVISGTTSVQPGTFNIAVTVFDVNGVVSATKTLVLTVVGPTVLTTPSPAASFTARTAITAISQTFTLAQGATVPAQGAWSATGLPAGLEINVNTGVITGTPAIGGTYPNVVVSLTDSYGARSTKTLRLVVVEPPTLSSPATLAPQVLNQALTSNQLNILVTPGSANIASFALRAPSVLPAGLTLNAETGAITGTPTTAGETRFTIIVTDAAGLTDQKEFTLYVGNKPSITNTTTPDRVTGTVVVDPLSTNVAMAPFAQTASAGSAPLASTGGWSATGLPAGMIINADTGAISGTPTTVVTNASFVVTLTDSKGLTATKTYTVSTIAPPTVTTANPAVMIIGNAIATWTQTTTQGSGALLSSNAWTSTALPTGLALNATTGAVTGTPTVAGEYDVTFTVADINGLTGSKELKIVVAAAPTIATTADLGIVAINREMTQVPQVVTIGTGAILAKDGWVVTAPNTGLPAGIWVNPNTGRIMGIPSVAGVQRFTLRVTDIYGLTATKEFTLNVVTPATITTADPLPIVTSGAAMTPVTLAATRGTGTIPTTGKVWSVDPSTSLPTGLTLNETTGEITGTTSQVGLFPVTFIITDSNGVKNSKTFTLPVLTAPVISNATAVAPAVTSLPAIGRNVVMSPVDLAATEGSYPLLESGAWSITAGTLPAGLTMNADTGLISGTATSLGTSTFTVRVRDQAGLSASAQFSILVAAAPTVTTPSPITPSAVRGSAITPVNQTFTLGSGATVPATGAWKAVGLPAGLSINADTGVISGTPSVSGNYIISVTLTDSNGVPGTANLNLTVAAPPSIDTALTLPPAAQNVAMDTLLQVFTQGTSAIPATGAWSIETGSLPAGLTMNADTGSLSGTPTASGKFTFTVKLTDSANASDTATLNLTVVEAGKNLAVLSLPTDVLDGVAADQTEIDLTGMATNALKLPITYSASPSSVCSVIPTNKLVIVAGGSCTVKASAGTGTTLVSDSKTFNVNKLQQTLQVTTPGTLIAGSNEKAAEATDDPAGFQLVAKASSGLSPIYTSLDPAVCDVDESGLVIWNADLTATPRVDSDFVCRVELTQPGDSKFQAATSQVISINAKHIEPPAPPGGITTEKAQTASLPITGGTTPMQGGNSFAVKVDNKKKTVTIQPMSKGRWIGPIYADIKITYTPKGSSTQMVQICKRNTFGIAVTDAKTKKVLTPALGGNNLVVPEAKLNAKGLATLIKKYQSMTQKYSTTKIVKGKKVVTPGYLDFKTFNGEATCVLDKNAYAAWKSGVPIEAKATVTRDRRWPTTYTKYKSYDWKKKSNNGIIYPTVVDWIIKIG